MDLKTRWMALDIDNSVDYRVECYLDDRLGDRQVTINTRQYGISLYQHNQGCPST